MTIVRISDDALARAGGADKLAAAYEAKGCEVHRTSSWGMHWLEPLVEIDGKGFGPATSRSVWAGTKACSRWRLKTSCPCLRGWPPRSPPWPA